MGGLLEGLYLDLPAESPKFLYSWLNANEWSDLILLPDDDQPSLHSCLLQMNVRSSYCHYRLTVVSLLESTSTQLTFPLGTQMLCILKQSRFKDTSHESYILLLNVLQHKLVLLAFFDPLQAINGQIGNWVLYTDAKVASTAR